MSLEKIVEGKQVIALVCCQWGDTGKGKYSDLFAKYWADVIARGTGGNNAGHTTVINGKKRIFHLIPAGIVYDKEGKTNILGNGMVIDPKILCGELDELDKEGLNYNNLMISEDAHVIMPYHIERDIKKDKSQKDGGVGSTGRGIGPCYADKIARRGIFIRDLFDADRLAKKIKKAIEFYPDVSVNIDQIIQELMPYAEKIRPFVRETISEMQKFVKQGKKILLEGAQGTLLSIEFGTYPYCTSSDCSANGTASGAGLPAGIVHVLGIVKFPYMTRVGAGPFPTEFGGSKSEEYCANAEHTVRFELNKYKIPFKEKEGFVSYDYHHPDIINLMNSKDPFEQGIGIRLAGEEYGATTGRPRRTGWTDLMALRYAISLNGPDLILTKPDVLQGADEFKLAISYERLNEFTRDPDALRKVKPVYISIEGFNQDISQINDIKDLPKGIAKAMWYITNAAGGFIRIISTGPEQNQNIIL